MALTTIETIAKAVEPIIASTKLTSAPTLMNLFARGAMRDKLNTQINWDVDLGGAGVAIEPVTADGADTAVDNVVPAQLRIGRYRVKHQFPLSRIAVEEAASLAPDELADLFESHVVRGVNTIMREINRLLLVGDGTAASAEVTGLATITDNTATYAGLSPVTYPDWKAIVNTNATNRALTTNLLLDLGQSIQEKESFYDFILTSPETGKKYNQLFNDVAGAWGTTPDEEVNGLTRIELGHGGRYYMGIPIIEDPMLTPGGIYLINSMDWNVYSFRLESTVGGDMAQTAIMDTDMTYGINVHIAELPSNNSAVRKFELYAMPQSRIFNRKSVAVLNKIS